VTATLNHDETQDQALAKLVTGNEWESAAEQPRQAGGRPDAGSLESWELAGDNISANARRW